MKKLQMLAMAICLLQLSLIAQTTAPKYPSLLWEITGNGLTKPSYLYGTMHVSNKVAFRLNDSVFTAIKNVDMVAFELDFGLWMDNIEELIKARNGFEYIEDCNLSNGLYYYLFKPSIPLKKHYEMALKSDPQIVNTILYRNNKSSIDNQENTYLDLYFYQVGKKLNKKTAALENFITSERSSNNSYIPDEDKDKANTIKEKNRIILREISKGKNTRTLFEDFYRSGNLDMIDSINKLTSSKNSFKYMLLERNVVMANSIDSLAKTQSLFSAVGCAHLPGDSGVIELLRSKGYTLRPLSFTSPSGIDSKVKKQIEEIRYPTTYSPYTTSDSSFTINLPSKVMELNDDMDGSKNYISFDIVNGGYYYIQRINYYGLLTGKSSDYMKKSIDSLLYETIPGKILSKKEITSNNGLKGYDIKNKTNKGDYQRYNIFFSTDEVVIFKYNGTGNYMNDGDEVNNSFKSIRFHQRETTEKAMYASKNGGFKVLLPKNTIKYKCKSASSYQRETITASQQEDYFYVGLSAINDFNYIEEDTFELNFLSDLFAKGIEYKVIDKNQKSSNNFPAVEAKMVKASDTLDLLVVKRGAFYYLLACKSANKNTKKAFFNSFTLTPFEYEQPFINYTDTTLRFSTKMPFESSPHNDLIKQENDISKSLRSYRSEKKESDIESKIFNRYYVSNETGEIVYVNYIKHSKFYQDKDLKEYWEKNTKFFTEYYNLIILNKTEKVNPKYNELTLTLADTNSKQVLKVKMILKCGSFYRLMSPIDSTEKNSLFVKTFFDNFEPQDTCIGGSVFNENLTENFFNKIYSTDSTTRANTRNATEYALSNFKDHHVPIIIQTISDTGFVNLSPEIKTQLLLNLGSLKSPLILPFFENMYPKYSDSIRIQRDILKAIINQNNNQSATTFLRLLQKEIPIASTQEGINEIFFMFNDSLQYAAKLFPEILQYTKYEFLKKPIYNLMAKCIQKDLILPIQYKLNKNDILRDAAYDMRTLIASNENSADSYFGYLFETNEVNKFGLFENNLSDYENLIYNYCIILQPFYKEKDVQTFVNKTVNIKIDNLNILILGYYLKKSTPLRDTLWNTYLTNTDTRIFAYKILSEIKRLDVGNAKDIDHETLLKSLIFTGEKSEEKKEKKDSVVFLDKIYFTAKADSGYLYIFKSKKEDSNVWKLAFTGLHFNDGKTINFDALINESDLPYETKLQYDTEIELIHNKIRILKRERASLKDIDTDPQEEGYGYDYYD